MDLSIASKERHERFVERALTSGQVWVLQLASDPSRWATSHIEMEESETGEIEEVPVVPFWSDRAYAARCAKGPWEVYAPRPLTLGEFKTVLRDLEDKGLMVGTNWNGDLVGHDCEPEELLKELAEHASVIGACKQGHARILT